MRDASPPTEVGRICPHAYETKYVRVSHATLSGTPRTRRSCCQRQAIGGTLTSGRSAGAPSHGTPAHLRMSTALWGAALYRVEAPPAPRATSVQAAPVRRFLPTGRRA